MIKTWLSHPLTRGLDLDDPRTTHLRRQIIREKSFLRHIYREWYAAIAAALPAGTGPVLELGAGAGFMDEFVPDLITSEVFCCPGVRTVLEGQRMPFAERTLRGIAMTSVLHHLSQPRLFFAEAARCVQPDGVIVMIEPWVTPWSRLVYGRFHHEPFQPDAQDWEVPQRGPLSGANSALPWIIFQRDREQLEREFPEWQIREIHPCMPFRYLVSGGVSMRGLMPGWMYWFWRLLEDSLSSWMDTLGMFALIVLERTQEKDAPE